MSQATEKYESDLIQKDAELKKCQQRYVGMHVRTYVCAQHM